MSDMLDFTYNDDEDLEDYDNYDYLEEDNEYKSCHFEEMDEDHDCLDYMECEECPYYYDDYEDW